MNLLTKASKWLNAWNRSRVLKGLALNSFTCNAKVAVKIKLSYATSDSRRPPMPGLNRVKTLSGVLLVLMTVSCITPASAGKVLDGKVNESETIRGGTGT